MDETFSPQRLLKQNRSIDCINDELPYIKGLFLASLAASTLLKSAQNVKVGLPEGCLSMR